MGTDQARGALLLPRAPVVLCRAPGLPWDALPTGDPGTQRGGSRQQPALCSGLGQLMPRCRWKARLCEQCRIEPCWRLLLKGPARSVVLAPAAPAWPPAACLVQVSARLVQPSAQPQALQALPAHLCTRAPLTGVPSDSSKQILSNGRVWAPHRVAVTKLPGLPG